ncbi:MAG TPA: hypothetical protein VKA53_09480 [Thermoanaerobaculia bacterium]|nr:hypothetical protein [Thermoanaerobaculia bacterium]
MPAADRILAQLTNIAATWRWMAILWHLYFVLLIVLIVVPDSPVRPSRRMAGVALTLPLASVALLAWWSGNPFNGVIFGAGAALFLAISSRMTPLRVRVASPFGLVAGLALAAFGWFYPHFTAAGAVWTYLYAAPVGLLPCPTLSIVAGLTMAFAGLESRAWAVAIALLGLWYGAFGALRLGVTIDWVLFTGSVVLFALQLKRVPDGAPGPSPDGDGASSR